jgi:hypothetical protein
MNMKRIDVAAIEAARLEAKAGLSAQDFFVQVKAPASRVG